MSNGEDSPRALFDRAVALQQAGRLPEAVAAYGALIAVVPAFATAHANLGVALRRLGRQDAALASYDRAVTLDPNDVSARYNRANLLADLNRPAEAMADYDAALAIQPGAPVVQASRANALRLLDRFDEAIAAYDQALSRDPSLAFAHNGRGAALFALGRSAEAVTAHERAIALNPGMAVAHRNRGVCLWRLGRYTDALASYDRAAELDPADPAAPVFRGQARLMLGQFRNGWPDYERRWEVDEIVAISAGLATPALRARFRPVASPFDLAGRDVLVVSEQGVGDVIMFASLIPDLVATARTVSLCCERRLHRLFAQSFPSVILLDAKAAEQADADVVMAIGSLARLYRSDAQDFPGRPYLQPRPQVRARWAERLGPNDGRRRIGLSWRGGTAATRRAERSIDLACLQPLFALPDCEIVSLQHGAQSPEIAAEIAVLDASLPRPLRQFPAGAIDNFEDLAGLVGALDLVVTVQTALVHLSGACGAPTLVMTPTTPEWRYGATGSAMPWYGSVQLMRQQPGEDWTPVIRRTAAEAARRLRR